MSYFLGIDIGHTKIKAALFDNAGTLICNEYHNTPFKDETVNLNELWHCVSHCIKDLISNNAVDPNRIKSLSCSGHGNGLYLLDKNKTPVNEGYSATYNKAEEIVSKWISSGTAKSIYSKTLQYIWSGQPLSILAYFKKNNTDLYNKTGTFFFCKDYINYCLTGEIYTDYSDASAAGIMDNRSGKYDRDIFERLGIPEMYDCVAPIKKSDDIIGFVSKEASDLTGLSVKTKVVAGMFDVAASLLGSGADSNKTLGMISGTWGINATIEKALPENQKFLQTTRYIDGNRYIFIESAPTSSVNLEWTLKNIFPDITYKDADEIVSSFSASDVKMLFLPYIYGDLKEDTYGGFLYMSPDDNYKTMIRAVYEGVAFGHKKQIDTLYDSGCVFDRVVFSGGAANSEIWCQIFSDILGKTLYVPEFADVGVLGNAMAAAVAEGEFSDTDEACRHMLHNYKVFYPENKNEEIYKQKYNTFKKII